MLSALLPNPSSAIKRYLLTCIASLSLEVLCSVYPFIFKLYRITSSKKIEVDKIIDFSNESLLKLKKRKGWVMRKILLLSLICLGATAMENGAQFTALVRRHNIQGLLILCSMAAVGVKGLMENSNELCANDSYCWKVTVPAISTSLVLGGTLLYKRLKA